MLHLSLHRASRLVGWAAIRSEAATCLRLAKAGLDRQPTPHMQFALPIRCASDRIAVSSETVRADPTDYELPGAFSDSRCRPQRPVAASSTLLKFAPESPCPDECRTPLRLQNAARGKALTMRGRLCHMSLLVRKIGLPSRLPDAG